MSQKTSIMKQEWHNLLFLHWSFPVKSIRPYIPSQLDIDTYSNRAWIGIIPFQMRRLRPSFAFSIPPISNFTEINLRTYVKDKYNRKGVWFFSLDTQNPLGNWIAKRFFHLNYRFAKTEFLTSDAQLNTCKFTLPNSKQSEQTFSWQHSESTFMPSQEPKSLECFLTERYRLFSYNQKKNTLLTGTLSHKPYQLNRPTLLEYSTDLFTSNGIEVPNAYPESILACKQTKVNVYPIETVI
jgi:uncharacterized protein YqjF (DUF2071 family)